MANTEFIGRAIQHRNCRSFVLETSQIGCTEASRHFVYSCSWYIWGLGIYLLNGIRKNLKGYRKRQEAISAHSFEEEFHEVAIKPRDYIRNKKADVLFQVAFFPSYRHMLVCIAYYHNLFDLKKRSPNLPFPMESVFTAPPIRMPRKVFRFNEPQLRYLLSNHPSNSV